MHVLINQYKGYIHITLSSYFQSLIFLFTGKSLQFISIEAKPLLLNLMHNDNSSTYQQI